MPQERDRVETVRSGLGPFRLLKKIPRLGGLNNRNLFLTVLEAGKSRSRQWQIQYPVRACFLDHRGLSLHCILT